MSTIATFAHALAPAIAALQSPQFPAALAHLLGHLVGADDVSILRYRQGHLPEVEHSAPLEADAPTTLDTYLTGPFLLDPFYRAAAIDHRFGVFHLRELAPTGFRDSEYYRAWYKHCGFQDECGLLIALDDGFINVALGRVASPSNPAPKFYKTQLSLLTDIFDAVAALARRHWQSQPDTAGPQSLREQLHTSLAAFGSSVLTRREQQVTELVLLGNSTRLIAEKLGISTETVKLHRKHAYAKLDVSSQAELFLLFMEALAYSPDSGGIDPLIAYHSKPASAP